MLAETVSVTQLSNFIQKALEEGIGYVSVRGEISNYKLHTSGHRYFTLKDEGAQINCTLWRGKPVSFAMADGQKVTITGKITVYPPRGQYQIEVISITASGKGDLHLAFEALKKKLDEAGYFDKSNKKPLPKFPLNIGVITSPTGAAIQDIFSTIQRRLPITTVYFRPAIVQGEEAGKDLVMAIKELNKLPIDVIIFGRGGGSLEDLWAFNMEIVADTIFNSEIPIISAVGHETDFTISDFVADFRAATPTAAAELVTTYTSDFLQNQLQVISSDLYDLIHNNIEDFKLRINNAESSYSMRKCPDVIRRYQQLTDDLSSRLAGNSDKYIVSLSKKIDYINTHINSLNPVNPLKKGFALLMEGDNYIGNDASLENYKNISIKRYDETAEITINKVKKETA